MAYIRLEDLQKFPIRQSHYDEENGNEHFICGIETVIEYAENLPTADIAEVKHGEWVKPYINFYGHPCHCCSECGFKASYQDKNFCPNCGAKMDGERK